MFSLHARWAPKLRPFVVFHFAQRGGSRNEFAGSELAAMIIVYVNELRVQSERIYNKEKLKLRYRKTSEVKWNEEEFYAPE